MVKREELCSDLSYLRIYASELDGVTLDIHLQGYDHFRDYIFFHDIIQISRLKFITLLNYPRP